MTEREKIIKVIDEWANKAVKANKFDGASVYNPHNAAELADALIAAGIGDVKEAELERKAYEVASNQYRIWFEEQKDRAEVAERALRDRATYSAMEDMDYFSLTSVAIEARAKELYKGWRREAEKELAEEGKE